MASWMSAGRSVRMRSLRKPLSQAQGAFDWPADRAQARAMFDTASGDHRGDALGSDQAPVLVVVVAAVGVEPPWPATWLADHAPDGRDGVEQRDQLGDIVSVPAGERDGERGAVCVGDQVMLGAGFASVDRARPGVVPL